MFGKKKKPSKQSTVDSGLVSVNIKNHKDKKGGHPHVIMEDIEDKHVSVGLTHDKYKGKGENSGKNYALEHNPLGGKDKSYLRRQGTVDSKESYYSPRKGKMSPKDYARAKEYGGRAKQKYLDRKKGKKK